MPNTERYNPTTAEALVAILVESSSTLNLDTFQERPMPSIIPGEGCLQPFVDSLREHGFQNLALVLAAAHRGERRIRQGKDFLNGVQASRYRTYMGVVEDLSSVVSKNASLFNDTAKVDIVREYRQGAGTTIGQIVLTFYERYLDSVIGNSKMTGPADRRAETLAKKENGSITSPMMKICLPTEKQMIAV